MSSWRNLGLSCILLHLHSHCVVLWIRNWQFSFRKSNARSSMKWACLEKFFMQNVIPKQVFIVQKHSSMCELWYFIIVHCHCDWGGPKGNLDLLWRLQLCIHIKEWKRKTMFSWIEHLYWDFVRLKTLLWRKPKKCQTEWI